MIVTRLYDRRVRQDLFVPEDDIPIIVADNVVEYYFDSLLNDGKVWDISDFPCVSPPFKRFFIETRIPKAVLNIMPKESSRGLNGWGFEFLVEDRDDKRKDVLCTFYEQIKKTVFLRNIRIKYTITKYGEFVDGSLMYQPLFENLPACNPIHLAYLNLDPLLLAISFMHCKNVRLEPVDPPEKLSRKHKKKHCKPLFRYHVLNIEPMKKILRKEGNIEKTGIRQALHICRGHFKDYRDGGGLFGKYKDIYWWESHVRGDINEGSVTKDYNIAL